MAYRVGRVGVCAARAVPAVGGLNRAGTIGEKRLLMMDAHNRKNVRQVGPELVRGHALRNSWPPERGPTKALLPALIDSPCASARGPRETGTRVLLAKLWWGYEPFAAKDALIAKQALNLPQIKRELQIRGRRQGRWVCWVFPNEKADELEAFPKTALTPNLVAAYLGETPSSQLNLWRNVLECICDLMDAREQTLPGIRGPFGTSAFFDVLPPQDRARVVAFVKLFDKAPCVKPDWLLRVLHRLNHHVQQSKLDPRAEDFVL